MSVYIVEPFTRVQRPETARRRTAVERKRVQRAETLRRKTVRALKRGL